MEYKANEDYFKLGDKKDLRSIGGYSKHGLLVAGYSINLDSIPKGMEKCLVDVNAKVDNKKPKTVKKTTKKGTK